MTNQSKMAEANSLFFITGLIFEANFVFKSVCSNQGSYERLWYGQFRLSVYVSNILLAAFWTSVIWEAVMWLLSGVVIFRPQEIGAKVARKMLVK